ncbi:MAG: hypothetical protein RL693_647 [Verrucomicrobiota bacterium]
MIMGPLLECQDGQIRRPGFYQITTIKNPAEDGMFLTGSGRTKNKMRQHDAESLALRVR